MKNDSKSTDFFRRYGPWAVVAGASDGLGAETPNYRLSLAEGHKTSVPAMSPHTVVAETLDALGKQPGVIPGFSNRLQAFIMRRLLPRWMAIRLMSRVLTGMYKVN